MVDALGFCGPAISTVGGVWDPVDGEYVTSALYAAMLAPTTLEGKNAMRRLPDAFVFTLYVFRPGRIAVGIGYAESGARAVYLSGHITDAMKLASTVYIP